MSVSLKCSDMGGPCDEVITGENEEELVANGMTHVKNAHPEMMPDIEAMTPEQKADWRKHSVHDKLAAQQAPDEGPATPQEEEEEREIAMM